MSGRKRKFWVVLELEHGYLLKACEHSEEAGLPSPETMRFGCSSADDVLFAMASELGYSVELLERLSERLNGRADREGPK